MQEAESAVLPSVVLDNNVYDKHGVLNVWQNWGSRFFNPKSAVTRVRVYRSSAERRATRSGTASEVWPQTSPFACWYCRQFFDGPPVMLPRARSPGMVWEVYGNFCSGYRGVACGLRYLQTGSQSFASNTQTALFIQLVREMFPRIDEHLHGRLPTGIDYRELEMFGGDTSVEEARATTLQPDLSSHIRFPPHINTVIGVAETYFGPMQGGRGERQIMASIAAETKEQASQAQVGAATDRDRRRAAAFQEQREEFDLRLMRVPTQEEIETRLRQKPTRLENVGTFEELAFSAEQSSEDAATTATATATTATATTTTAIASMSTIPPQKKSRSKKS